MGSEGHIKGDISETENDPGDPEIADAIHHRPTWVVAAKCGFGFFFIQEIVHIDILRLHGHAPDVLEEMRGMGILFRVAVGVMHPVQDGISPGVQKGRALGQKGQAIKEPFPEFIHLKHLMRGIAVQEERLREQGKEPMREEEYEYDTHK